MAGESVRLLSACLVIINEGLRLLLPGCPLKMRANSKWNREKVGGDRFAVEFVLGVTLRMRLVIIILIRYFPKRINISQRDIS